VEIQRYAYSGDQPLTVVPRRPYHKQAGSHPAGVYFCRDGYVLVWGGIGSGRLARLAQMMEMPELASDQRFHTAMAMSQHGDEFEAIFMPWLMEHDREEVRNLAQLHRLPWSIPLTIDELSHDPQFASRAFFVKICHPRAGEQRYPGPPFRFLDSPLRAPSPAPLIGEHNRAIYAGWLGLSIPELGRLGEVGAI
jgi:formyl-CoA transferase